jgi:hypothetical protein
MPSINALQAHPAGIADILGDQVGSLLRRIAQGFVDAAGFLLQVTIDDLNGGLRVDLSAGWIQTVLGQMRYLAFFLIALMFTLQVITAMLRKDHRGLWRAVGGSALALLGGAAATAIAAAVLLVVDQFTAFILAPAQKTAEDTMVKIFAMDGTIDVAGWLVVIIIAGLACLAFLFIHLVLIGRNAMVIATVVFAPFAFAGATTDRTKTWIVKWLEILIALALAKFAIAVILTLGFLSLADSVAAPGGPSTTQVMTGALWLFVAAFSPLATMKFVTFAGGELAASHPGAGGEAVGNVNSAGYTASTAARLNPIHARFRRSPLPPKIPGGTP